MNNYKSGRNDSALYKHKINDHKDEEMNFRMEITKTFRDPLSRQANEAVRISERKKIELLNSKNEFNHPPRKARVVIRGSIPKVLYFSSLFKCNANTFLTSTSENASNCT